MNTEFDARPVHNGPEELYGENYVSLLEQLRGMDYFQRQALESRLRREDPALWLCGRCKRVYRAEIYDRGLPERMRQHIPGIDHGFWPFGEGMARCFCSSSPVPLWPWFFDPGPTGKEGLLRSLRAELEKQGEEIKRLTAKLEKRRVAAEAAEREWKAEGERRRQEIPDFVFPHGTVDSTLQLGELLAWTPEKGGIAPPDPMSEEVRRNKLVEEGGRTDGPPVYIHPSNPEPTVMSLTLYEMAVPKADLAPEEVTDGVRVDLRRKIFVVDDANKGNAIRALIDSPTGLAEFDLPWTLRTMQDLRCCLTTKIDRVQPQAQQMKRR